MKYLEPPDKAGLLIGKRYQDIEPNCNRES